MVVLKGIPSILSPDLLYTLAKMGHGDELDYVSISEEGSVTPDDAPLALAAASTPAPEAAPPTPATSSANMTPQRVFSVLADANFPASSTCRCGPAEIRADGLRIPELLEAILKLFPLDTYVDRPAAVMDLVPSDRQSGLAVPVWETYSGLLKEAGSDKPLEKVERFAFYERAKKSFAVVATGETSLYGNLIIKKGVIPAEDQC